MEELCKKQAETIKLLTDAILINSKQEYIKSIKHICIAIITSFTILICFFYYMYFTSDYSKEICAKNATKHTENYHFVFYPRYGRKIFNIPNDAKENTSPHAEFAFFNRNDGSIGIDNSNIENIKYDFFLHGYIL